MNHPLHKIVSVVMAFVVMFSTLSFTINMHYCGDTLVETVVFQKAKGCGMDMQQPASEGCSITKKNCCKDQQLIVEGQDELQLQLHTISFEEQVFITAFIYTYTIGFENIDNKVTSFQNYKPPLVIRQLFKIDETYLI